MLQNSRQSIQSRVAPRGLAASCLALALLAALEGCDRAPSRPNSTGATSVFVSILPQSYFVKRIGGEHVNVDVLIGAGQSEHSYEPTPRQMMDLGEARILFTIGVSAEKRIVEQARQLHKNLTIVETQRGIKLRTIAEDEACNDPSHDHGPGEHHHHDHDHDHAGDDPHIWLDPQLVKFQAQTICDALVAADPARAESYRANLNAFHADLDAIDARIAAALAPLKGRELFVFHPSYGYFCDRYGIRQVAVEQEGKEPSLKQLEALQARARAAGVKIVFYQPQFSRQPAEVIARTIGGAAVPMDPLAEDFLKNLEDMATKIEQALAAQADQHKPAGSD